MRCCAGASPRANGHARATSFRCRFRRAASRRHGACIYGAGDRCRWALERFGHHPSASSAACFGFRRAGSLCALCRDSQRSILGARCGSEIVRPALNGGRLTSGTAGPELPRVLVGSRMLKQANGWAVGPVYGGGNGRTISCYFERSRSADETSYKASHRVRLTRFIA